MENTLEPRSLLRLNIYIDFHIGPCPKFHFRTF